MGHEISFNIEFDATKVKIYKIVDLFIYLSFAFGIFSTFCLKLKSIANNFILYYPNLCHLQILFETISATKTSFADLLKG